MPVVSGKADRGGGESRGKLSLVVVVVVLAIAAAVYSITRTVTRNQGRNMGSLGGFVGKAEMMGKGVAEPGAGGEESGREGPGASGREDPGPQTMLGGKGR
jgi:hypothetical protein